MSNVDHLLIMVKLHLEIFFLLGYCCSLVTFSSLGQNFLNKSLYNLPVGWYPLGNVP
jgi:hypothetical protein